MPWLAESWEVNDDATEFTFHLRDDVTFSDGTPLTADVVKANFDDIIANGAKANAALPAFTGYVGDHRRRPADRHRHVLRPERPVPPGDVDRRPRLRRRRARWRCRSRSGPRPASSARGPFTLDHYTKDSEVVLDKRPGYAWAPEARANDGEAYLDQSCSRSSPRRACAPAPCSPGRST